MTVHLLRVTHDPESHAEDCCDDCRAEVICPGVTASCRIWWECGRCRDVMARLTVEGCDVYEERVEENGAAHGEDHERINGVWMTPGTTCMAYSLDHDGDAVAFHYGVSLLDGDHPVDLEADEWSVEVLLHPRSAMRGWLVDPPADSSLWYLRGDVEQFRHKHPSPHGQCRVHPITGEHHNVIRLGSHTYVRPCTLGHTEEDRWPYP